MNVQLGIYMFRLLADRSLALILFFDTFSLVVSLASIFHEASAVAEHDICWGYLGK